MKPIRAIYEKGVFRPTEPVTVIDEVTHHEARTLCV